MVRELGLERRETVRSLSAVGVGELREAAPSNGKKTSECKVGRESCAFMIPEASYRHHLRSVKTNADSTIGRLIFSFLRVNQSSVWQSKYPFNISTITHTSQAKDINDYHETENGLIGFRVISGKGVKTEERSEILFEGKKGIKNVTDYLEETGMGPMGEDFFCSQANFNNALGKRKVSVVDASVQLVNGAVEFLNCSMHSSETVLYHRAHDEL